MLRAVSQATSLASAVEIGTGAEKESRRSDEDERENNVPDELEPRQRLLREKSVNHARVDSQENDSAPDARDSPERFVAKLAQKSECRGKEEHQNSADFDFLLAPLRVENHADAVQSPQTMKFQLAPCQSPPISCVIIALVCLAMVRLESGRKIPQSASDSKRIPRAQATIKLPERMTAMAEMTKVQKKVPKLARRFPPRGM